MRMTNKNPQRLYSSLLTSTLALGAVFGLEPVAQAEGPSETLCMQPVFNAGGNDQTLKCTANDVKIAKATDVFPLQCNQGETFDLKATFLVELSGGGSNQTRYDLGLYFDVSGDVTNGAREGICTLDIITSSNGGDYVQLDPSPPDICGDISTAPGNNPLSPTLTIPDVVCVDTDGDGFLNLPNCTSWRQPGANQVCDSVTDAFPGTASKCNCDDNFNVPVVVETGTAGLKKRPTQALVTYEVVVENKSNVRELSLTSLCDDKYGTIDGAGCPAGTLGTVQSTTCDLPQTLAPLSQAGDHDYDCTFTVLVTPSNDSPNPVVDIVTATLDPDVGTNFTVEGSASATVFLPQPAP